MRNTRPAGRSAVRAGGATGAMIVVALSVLGGCSTTRVESGANLSPGESATVHILGPRASFEVYNFGPQPLEYRLEESGSVSGGTLEPRTQIAGSRGRGDMTLTITNPGPDRARATIETRSRGGVEIGQGPAGGEPTPSR